MSSMEPLPETLEAADELDPVMDDGELLPSLLGLATEAQDLVPELVAVSLSRIKEGLTFTLVAGPDAQRSSEAGDPEAAAQDAPAMRAAPEPDDVLDEERWRALAETTAARTIRSTLTLPVMAEGDVVETVSLYATSEAAFVGHHDQMAGVFGAWAAGAVTNADLSFSTRDEARLAPTRVRERIIIDVAIGILAARLNLEVTEAERRMELAAADAGLELIALARAIVRTHEQR